MAARYNGNQNGRQSKDANQGTSAPSRNLAGWSDGAMSKEARDAIAGRPPSGPRVGEAIRSPNVAQIPAPEGWEVQVIQPTEEVRSALAAESERASIGYPRLAAGFNVPPSPLENLSGNDNVPGFTSSREPLAGAFESTDRPLDGAFGIRQSSPSIFGAALTDPAAAPEVTGVFGPQLKQPPRGTDPNPLTPPDRGVSPPNSLPGWDIGNVPPELLGRKL